MLRLTDLRPAVIGLALALVPLSLGACSSHGGADAGTTVESLAPLPVPPGHVGDLFVRAPAATWAKARGSLGGAALFLPQSFGGLVATLVGLPITLSGEIDEAVPVVGAAARQGRGPLQVAVGIHVKAGDRFIAQLTTGESARFNATVDPTTHVTLLTDKVAPESARLALGVFGNYLLVAATPADLSALGPYVVRTLGPAAAPADDFAMELPEAALAGPVRDQARELRGKSEGAAATIIPLSGLLDTAITLLGDASHGHLGVNLDTSALHGRLTLTPKPGGAGSQLIADLAVGDVKPLLALPEATTLGLLWRESPAARAENAPKQADALARLLGSDVGADDKAAITAALLGEAQARGDFQTVGIAWNGTGPTAVVRAPAGDTDRMKKALKQIVDLGNLASFKKALAALGIKLAVDKAVVENLVGDVTRVRLARVDADGKDPKRRQGREGRGPPATRSSRPHLRRRLPRPRRRRPSISSTSWTAAASSPLPATIPGTPCAPSPRRPRGPTSGPTRRWRARSGASARTPPSCSSPTRSGSRR